MQTNGAAPGVQVSFESASKHAQCESELAKAVEPTTYENAESEPAKAVETTTHNQRPIADKRTFPLIAKSTHICSEEEMKESSTYWHCRDVRLTAVGNFGRFL